MPVEPSTSIDPLSLEIAAPFVNKLQVVVAGANVRISFAEGVANQPANYRAAVMMSLDDARDLALAILQSLPAPALNIAALSQGKTLLGSLGGGGTGVAQSSQPQGSPKSLLDAIIRGKRDG